MPKTQVFFFQDVDGRAPVREWLLELRSRDARAHAKCTAALTKERAVPEIDIRRALRRKALTEQNPGRHIHED